MRGSGTLSPACGRAGALPARQSRRAGAAAAGTRRRRPSCTSSATRYGGWLVVMLDSTVPGRVPRSPRRGRARAARRGARPASGRARARLPAPSPGTARQPLAGRADARQCDRAVRGARATSGRARPALGPRRTRPLDGIAATCACMGTPSTCMQFAPDADEFDVDDATTRLPLARARHRWPHRHRHRVGGADDD